MAKNFFSNTICLQTLSQLIFNKLKQNCVDVKAKTPWRKSNSFSNDPSDSPFRRGIIIKSQLKGDS